MEFLFAMRYQPKYLDMKFMEAAAQFAGKMLIFKNARVSRNDVGKG